MTLIDSNPTHGFNIFSMVVGSGLLVNWKFGCCSGSSQVMGAIETWKASFLMPACLAVCFISSRIEDLKGELVWTCL